MVNHYLRRIEVFGSIEKLNKLIAQYEDERDIEEKSFSAQQPYVNISPWDPRVTQRRSNEKLLTLVEHVKSWTIRWWEKQGYLATTINSGTGFTVSVSELNDVISAQS